MRLLAVDIGNTSTTIGLYADDIHAEHGAVETRTNTLQLQQRFHFPTRALTHRGLTREALVAPLRDQRAPDIIGVASVVPWASDEMIVVLHELYPGALILVITSSGIPLQITYPNPDELGTDRLLGALAAYHIWGQQQHRPCLVVDMGTATTYDCVTAEGEYLGGAIAPGIELGAHALAQRAAQLPEIELSFPSSVIGRTTVESIQSGIMYGGLAQLEGFIARLSHYAFQETRPIVIATGGLSNLFAGRTSMLDVFAPDLILDGIAIATRELARKDIDELAKQAA